MKKKIFILFLVFLAFKLQAQNGLEAIVVENYYVSDVNDSIGNDAVSSVPGTLPVGSKTYRIYVDLLPGYKFQAAYGINSPVHEFFISTTTTFFNNEDRGATTPNAINHNFMDDNTVMLDSWLSVGAASSTKMGIMKSNDNGVNTVVNNDGLLINTDSWAGIPLTTQDGFFDATAAAPQVTLVGITNEILVFDNLTTTDTLFYTDNGSLACLGGTYGPDTIDNKILIAQITTNGELCFELNLQIGTPAGGVENYVAQNPVGNEILRSDLSWCSTVGIENLNASVSSFNVFPNPLIDVFTLEIIPSKTFTANYVIYNAEGKVIFQKKLGTISEKYLEYVDMSSYTKGVYIVELFSGGTSSIRKIIKE
ncbi:MAG: T9SS type A sorting domain-containing protein [Bacteroidia bacterium]